MAAQPPPALPPELRERLLADLTAGRTVTLDEATLADPTIREHLPRLLEELERHAAPPSASPRIPGYAVLGEIGHGGMSTVYLARHEALQRHVALKRMPEWLGGQQRARERLLREARALARLAHPNIVGIHDVLADGDCLAIAMEWVDGLTLANLLRMLPEHPGDDDLAILRHALGTPPDAVAGLGDSATRWFVGCAAAIARALHHVHQHGLLHLDVKPSNVLVRRDGTPLLADFGVVREVDVDPAVTRSFAGTPLYAAPEQLRRDDRSIGAHTDVYGLGITLYELLARRQPLRQESLTQLMRDIQAGNLPPLARLGWVPTDLATVVHKAIDPDLGRRYPTAAAFADDLQAFLEGRPVAARPVGPFGRLRRWVRCEPWQAVAAGALLGLTPIAIGLGGVLLAELPRITAARDADLQRQHARLVQSTFQTFLIRQETNQELIDELREALRQAPDQTRIRACLLTIVAMQDRGAGRRLLDELPPTADTGLGDRLLRDRLAADRDYFDAAAIAQLAASNHDFDHLLLILDRILWQTSSQRPDALEPIGPLLDRLVLIGPDPLLHGLRAWVAALQGNTTVLDDSTFAIQRNWPDEAPVQAWPVLARSLREPGPAAELCRQFLARHPDDFVMPCLLLRCLQQLGDLEAVVAYRVPPDFPRRATIDFMRARALARLGRHAEALATLPGPADRWHPVDQRWLAVVELADPAAALACYDQVLAMPSPQRVHVRMALDFALQTKNAALLERSCQVGLARFPQDPIYRWVLAEHLLRRAAYAEAARWLDGLELNPQDFAGHGLSVAKILAGDKQWSRLVDHATRWLAAAPADAPAAEFYLGVGHARLGAPDLARRHLLRNLELGATVKRNYFEAHLELAWLDLDPAHAERNPARGLAQLGKCGVSRSVVRERCRTHRWLALILAEACAAEGNLADARQLVREASAGNHKASPTDPADLDARLQAAKVRFGVQ